MDEIIALVGSKAGNKSAGLYGHLIRLRSIGVKAAKFLKNFGYAATSGKNSAKICFTPDELDVLSVLQDIITEILDRYNNWKP